MGCLRAIKGFQNDTLTAIALGSPPEQDRKTLFLKTIHILDTGPVETKHRQGKNCLSCQLAFTVLARTECNTIKPFCQICSVVQQ